MDLLCIKTSGANWGIFFTQSKWYPIHSRTNVHLNIITNPVTYWNQINMVSEAKDWVKKGYAYDELHKIIPGFKTLEQIDKEYTTRTLLPHIVILGDEGYKHFFLELTKEEMLDKYGSIEFTQSVDFLEDNFITRQDFRDDIIGDILD
jgi:hypothetical protein